MQKLPLEGDELLYSPQEDLSPVACNLLLLRDSFGLRSCINTLLRMWNPTGAQASVQGVFPPSYRGLQSRAAALLGERNLTGIKGGGGEFKRHTAKQTATLNLGERDDHFSIVFEPARPDPPHDCRPAGTPHRPTAAS